MKLDKLYCRYGELIDRYFAMGLTATEAREKERLKRLLDKYEGKPEAPVSPEACGRDGLATN